MKAVVTKTDGKKVFGSVSPMANGILRIELDSDQAGESGIDHPDIYLSPSSWSEIKVLGTGDVPKEPLEGE